MSEDDVQVVLEQFEAANRRDFERVMDMYADDVWMIVWPDSGPNPGTYEGKEEVGEWFGDWFRTFDRDYHFEIDEAKALEGGVVFLHANHGGTGRLSGAEVRGENDYLYRVRDGKISKVGFFATREEALEAAQLPEWSGPKTD